MMSFSIILLFMVVTIQLLPMSVVKGDAFISGAGKTYSPFVRLDRYNETLTCGAAEKASATFVCSSELIKCTVALQYSFSTTETFSLSKKAGLSLDFNVLTKAIKTSFEITLGYSWASSASNQNSYTCDMKPGQSAYVTFTPKYLEIRGKLTVDNRGERDVLYKIPQTVSGDRLDGFVYCEVYYTSVGPPKSNKRPFKCDKIVKTNFPQEYTRYSKQCQSPCVDKGTSYWWCYDRVRMDGTKTWEYCSPNPSVTINGDNCKDKCGKGGNKDYNWCYTSKSWDYCGSI